MAHRSSRRSVAPSARRRRLASESSAKQPSEPMSRASSSVAPGRSEPSSPHSRPPAATPAAAPAVPPPPAASEVYEVEDMDGDTNAEYTPLAAGAATTAAAGLPASTAPLAGGANGAAATAGEQDMNFLIEEID